VRAGRSRLSGYGCRPEATRPGSEVELGLTPVHARPLMLEPPLARIVLERPSLDDQYPITAFANGPCRPASPASVDAVRPSRPRAGQERGAAEADARPSTQGFVAPLELTMQTARGRLPGL